MIRFEHSLSFCLLLFPLFLSHCGGSGSQGIFTEPNLLAVDSTNDRLFVLEKTGNIFLLTASTQRTVGKQPVINKGREVDIHEILPTIPLHVVVESRGDTSRLFVLGTIINDDGTHSTNQIQVIDYDGENFSQPDFSPVALDDGADATDETDDTFGDMVVDGDNDRLYVTDSSGALLFVFNTSDGTLEDAVAIAGIPNALSLSENRLYVANASDVDAEQVVTVINTDDLTTTAIDLDVPTQDISVFANDTGTVLITKVYQSLRVLVRTVDTATFADSAPIPAENNSAEDGEVNTDNTLSSALGNLLLTRDGSDVIYGYLPQADGNIALLTILADLTSFTASTLETLSRVAESTDVLLTDGNVGSTVFMTAVSSGNILYTDVGSDDVQEKF